MKKLLLSIPISLSLLLSVRLPVWADGMPGYHCDQEDLPRPYLKVVNDGDDGRTIREVIREYGLSRKRCGSIVFIYGGDIRAAKEALCSRSRELCERSVVVGGGGGHRRHYDDDEW